MNDLRDETLRAATNAALLPQATPLQPPTIRFPTPFFLLFSEAAPKSKRGYLKISCNFHVCTPYSSFPNQRPEITEQTDFRRKLGRGRWWQAVSSAPRNPSSGTHSNPFRTGAEVPKSQQRVAQPETSCWRLLSSQDQRLGSFLEESTRGAHSPGQGPALRLPRAQGSGQAQTASRASRVSN